MPYHIWQYDFRKYSYKSARRDLGVITVVRSVCTPYGRARIPGSSDLRVCEVSVNEDIAL